MNRICNQIAFTWIMEVKRQKKQMKIKPVLFRPLPETTDTLRGEVLCYRW